MIKGGKRKPINNGVFHIRLGTNVEVHSSFNSENWSQRPSLSQNFIAIICNQISIKYGCIVDF